jgi:hypothetical protein
VIVLHSTFAQAERVGYGFVLPNEVVRNAPRKGLFVVARRTPGNWYTAQQDDGNDGRVAQLGEHLLCKQGVRGSNPLTSTIFLSDCKTLTRFTSIPISPFWFLLCTNCARMGYWTVTVHIGAAIRVLAVTASISLARRLSFSSASRFICNFI